MSVSNTRYTPRLGRRSQGIASLVDSEGGNKVQTHPVIFEIFL